MRLTGMSDIELDLDFDPITRPRVLVIDDSATIRAVLFSLLSAEHEVLQAKDGMMGLEQARRTPQPDLILLDVEMPGVDGFEVSRRLTQDPATLHIPAICLTSLSNVQPEG